MNLQGVKEEEDFVSGTVAKRIIENIKSDFKLDALQMIIDAERAKCRKEIAMRHARIAGYISTILATWDSMFTEIVRSRRRCEKRNDVCLWLDPAFKNEMDVFDSEMTTAHTRAVIDLLRGTPKCNCKAASSDIKARIMQSMDNNNGQTTVILCDVHSSIRFSLPGVGVTMEYKVCIDKKMERYMYIYDLHKNVS